MTAPYLELEIYWEQPIPFDVSELDPLQAVVMPLGGIIIGNVGGSGGGAVNSVNGQMGVVTLDAEDVGADVAGSAQTVSEALQPQITVNTDAVAMLTALLSALQSAKADVTYVNAQIATLVGTDTQTLAAIQAISAELADNEDLLSALNQTVANRVRFDVATQGLTALQKYNARTNIGAEEVGTAATLMSQITAASIGAVTANQLANVAFSGSYNDLSNKPSITGTLLTGLTSASAAAISATDTIIGALAKLQANVDTKADATNTLALINTKISSTLLGTVNGVATLGSDGLLTAAQRPASTGGADDIIWITPTRASPSYDFVSGFDDGTRPFQLGKDANGVIWVQGVLRMTGNYSYTSLSNFQTLPSTHMIKGMTNDYPSYIKLNSVQPIVPNGNQQSPSLLISYLSGVQKLALNASYSSSSTTIIVFNRQPLGYALNP